MKKKINQTQITKRIKEERKTKTKIKTKIRIKTQKTKVKKMKKKKKKKKKKMKMKKVIKNLIISHIQYHIKIKHWEIIGMNLMIQ